jgi:hypothetical protein
MEPKLILGLALVLGVGLFAIFIISGRPEFQREPHRQS